MNVALSIFNSSIGRKLVMSITGLFLIMFLVVHCGINALIFFNDSGEAFEAGAEFMAKNPLIRTMEVVLFLGIILHVVQSLMVTRENQKARPMSYSVNSGNANSKWYSRSMGLLGTLILMFLIMHLNHFWIESRITSRDNTLYDDMLETFSQAWVVGLYVLAMISLAFHLMHGFQSAFQSLGLNHRSYTPIIKAVGLWFSILIPLIFALMPIAMFLGLVY